MGKNVERAIQGSLESGLIREPLRLEDVYYHTNLGLLGRIDKLLAPYD